MSLGQQIQKYIDNFREEEAREDSQADLFAG